jgi:molybdopterin synthase catalytic subunit
VLIFSVSLFVRPNSQGEFSDSDQGMANFLCDVLLTSETLSPPAVLMDAGSGAVVDFRGVVRKSENGRAIDGIEYEAHTVMADHQMRDIARCAAEKFGLHRVILHHRNGYVPAGEASLFLRVSSPHRAAAFSAAEWIVEELKQRVPIWKRPQFRSPVPAGEECQETRVVRETVTAKRADR